MQTGAAEFWHAAFMTALRLLGKNLQASFPDISER